MRRHRFGTPVETFHRGLAVRAARWPHARSGTSTHDTKRSEDVRARLNVLSELPGEWEKHLLRWRRWNQSLKQVVDGITVPTPGEEILLYQTLLGVWPLYPSEEESLLARLRNFVV